MYIDAVHTKDQIVHWERDSSGTLKKLTSPAPYYCWVNDLNGKDISLFGDRLSKKTFDTRKKYNRFVDKSAPSILWESDISPVYKFLSDNYYKSESTPVNIGFFDIEVDYDPKLGFPNYDNPYGEITSISLFNVKENRYHMMILTDDKSIILKDEHENLEVLTYHCVTERQLMDTFYHLIKDIDVLSSWNGDFFDIPYIVQRSRIIYGEKGKHMLSRDGYTCEKITGKDDFGNETTSFKPVGRVHLDLLLLYKRFTFGERENYKLDTIVEFELKEKKLKFDGTLRELWLNDKRKYFEYSLHDSRLLKNLDLKKKLIDLTVIMSRQATIKFNDIFGSIKYLEYAVRNYSHFDRKQALRLPDKDQNIIRKKFPGGYVLPTRPGLYGWVCSIDLTSLYPSVIRSINISPETHLFQCQNDNEDFIKVVEGSEEMVTLTSYADKQIFTMSGKDVKQLLKEDDMTISANGSIFCNRQGLLPEVSNVWFAERKKTKQLAKKYEKAGDKKNAEFYSMREQLVKLSLNSLYGAISNPFCRFYSLDLAKSVTLTGQEIEKFQMWKSDQVVKTYNEVNDG